MGRATFPVFFPIISRGRANPREAARVRVPRYAAASLSGSDVLPRAARSCGAAGFGEAFLFGPFSFLPDLPRSFAAERESGGRGAAMPRGAAVPVRPQEGPARAVEDKSGG